MARFPPRPRPRPRPGRPPTLAPCPQLLRQLAPPVSARPCQRLRRRRRPASARLRAQAGCSRECSTRRDGGRRVSPVCVRPSGPTSACSARLPSERRKRRGGNDDSILGTSQPAKTPPSGPHHATAQPAPRAPSVAHTLPGCMCGTPCLPRARCARVASRVPPARRHSPASPHAPGQFPLARSLARPPAGCLPRPRIPPSPPLPRPRHPAPADRPPPCPPCADRPPPLSRTAPRASSAPSSIVCPGHHASPPSSASASPCRVAQPCCASRLRPQRRRAPTRRPPMLLLLLLFLLHAASLPPACAPCTLSVGPQTSGSMISDLASCQYISIQPQPDAAPCLSHVPLLSLLHGHTACGAHMQDTNVARTTRGPAGCTAPGESSRRQSSRCSAAHYQHEPWLSAASALSSPLGPATVPVASRQSRGKQESPPAHTHTHIYIYI